MPVGENIRKYRKKAHMTQKDLALKSGLATITIQQYERGVREPRLDTLFAISKALGVLPTQLSNDFSEELALWIENHPNEKSYGIIIDNSVEDPLESDPDYKYALGEISGLLKLLNPDGKETAIERVQELTEIPKYKADK